MSLSKNAIQDLRITLRKSFGEEFDSAFTDEQIERIGLLMMTSILESLKIRYQEQ